MYCPFCSYAETKVLESRLIEGAMRRRRECLSCNNRFTTYEKAVVSLMVKKRDGHEEEFDKEKLALSITRACAKAEPDVTKKITQRVQQKVLARKQNPIRSKVIGTIVLRELKRRDKLAYLRFASVYKQMDDPKVLKQEISLLT